MSATHRRVPEPTAAAVAHEVPSEHVKWLKSPYFNEQVALVVGLQRLLPRWLVRVIALSSVFGSGAASFLVPCAVYWWVDPEVRR